MKTILKAEKVCKTYIMGEVKVEALKDAYFELHEGELVVVLGPSGSGKSTLLNIIGGMDKATDGTLYFHDISLHNADRPKLTAYRRNDVVFVFQFYNLMPNLAAFENINLAAQISKNPLSINKLLGEVGLANRDEHFPSQLSGGEQQCIALDYKTSIQILKILKEFCVKYQKTVVLSHVNRYAGALSFNRCHDSVHRFETTGGTTTWADWYNESHWL